MPDAPILLTNSEVSDRLLSNRPRLSSKTCGWQGLTLEYRCMGAGNMPEIYTPWHLITFAVNAPKTPKVVRCSGGKQWRDEARLGDAVIIPAMVGYTLLDYTDDISHNWSPIAQIQTNQVLVTQGVYRYVRYPMYTAHLLWGLAQRLLITNWLVGWSGLIAFVLLCCVRIPKEEVLM